VHLNAEGIHVANAHESKARTRADRHGVRGGRGGGGELFNRYFHLLFTYCQQNDAVELGLGLGLGLGYGCGAKAQTKTKSLG
jgi:hypothetical protein